MWVYGQSVGGRGALRQAGFLSAVKSRSRAFDLWAIGAVNQTEERLLKHANHFFTA